ncbi:hypothetical protein G6N76_08990 [Rhizobium daejeonense]|uniref:Uncharacterized protein n=1 Tax=Rhizobium daejeonense TaxID=240521 RepID=A0A6M1S0N5_9HYPH|nr:hypothetical protein [Rhizobium daejeonense]NGO63811.1 hypothetical protein [Rhizobium daejeonense]
MNRQDRKPRAIAIARTRDAEMARLRNLAILCFGAAAAIAALAIGLAG